MCVCVRLFRQSIVCDLSFRFRCRRRPPRPPVRVFFVSVSRSVGSVSCVLQVFASLEEEIIIVEGEVEDEIVICQD